MDEFPHIAVEHKVLKRHVHFRFNPERCREAGLQETPNADKYEVIKLRRVYHFNKDTADHVVLTIPKPVFVVVDRNQLPEENSSKLKHNAEYVMEEKSTYQNVKNTESRNEEYCCDTQEDELIIEKCVPEVGESSNAHKNPTERFDNITVSSSDDLLPKSTTNCNESKSKTCTFEHNHCTSNNQKDLSNTIDGKNQHVINEELLYNASEYSTNQINPPSLVMDNIPSHNDQSLSLEELIQVLQTNKKIGANELDTLSVFEELSIHEQIFNENPQENSKNIAFGVVSDVFEPIQQISAADEILWTELYESTSEEVSRKASPEVYESQLDPVEEEMRKIHGEYVAQDHSYVQPLDSNEEFHSSSSSRNMNLLELFKKIQEPVLEENCRTDMKISHVDESFEVPPLVIDEEGDEELASEIRKFIVTQDGHEAEQEIKTQELSNLSSGFENHSEIQDSSKEQEISLDLRKVQNFHKSKEKYAKKRTISGENTLSLKGKNSEQPIPGGSDVEGSQTGIHNCIASESDILKHSIYDDPIPEECPKKGLCAERNHSSPITKDFRILSDIVEQPIHTGHTWKDDLVTGKPIQDGYMVKSLQILEHSPIAEDSLNAKEPIRDDPIVKSFQIQGNENNKHIAEANKILEQPIPDGPRPEESLENDFSTELSQRGSIGKDFLPLSEIMEQPIQGVTPLVYPHDDFHTEEPIQDCFIVRNAETLEDSPIGEGPEVLDCSISKHSPDLEQPIQNGVNAVKLIPDDPATKGVQFSSNITVANEFKILKQSVPDDPISKMPQDLEQPIQDGSFAKDYLTLNNSPITKKFETGEGPTCHVLIQEEPQLLAKPTQDYFSVQEPSQDCPIGEGSRIKYNTSLTDNSEIKEEPIFDKSIPEEPRQDSLKTEESVVDGDIIKSSQNFNNNFSSEESTIIQDGQSSEKSQVLRQLIQNGLNAKETIRNNNIKVCQNLHNSLIPKESEILGQSIRDDSILEEYQDLEQPLQNNFIVEVPIQANSTVKDILILDNRPVIKEFKTLENPILEESQVLEKNPQDCFNAEELIRDNSSKVRKNSLHNNIITEASQHLEQPIQDDLKVVEPKVFREPIPLVEKSQILQQPINNPFILQKPTLLKQPDEDNLVVKQLQVIVKPLPADIIENMSTFLKTPVKIYFNRRRSQNSPLQNGPMERQFKCDSNSTHHGPKTFQKPFRSKSHIKESKILDKHVLKKSTVLENILQSPLPKIYQLLENPVLSATEKIKNLENSYEIKSQILKSILQSPNKKKHKLLENYDSLGCANKKEPKILETPELNIPETKSIVIHKSGKSKRQKVAKKPLQSTNQADSNAFVIEQEHNVEEKNILNTCNLEPKLLENDSVSCRSIEEPCNNGTVPKMSRQNHVEGEHRILEKASPNLTQNDIVNSSRHYVGETSVNGTMEIGSIQSCVEQGFDNLKKYLNDIEKGCIIESLIRDDGLNLGEKCVSDPTATVLIQNSIEKEPNILEKSPNTDLIRIDNSDHSVARKTRFVKLSKENSNDQRPNFLKKSHPSFLGNKSSTVENPFDCKRSKIVKQPLDSTTEEVQKIRKKFQQVFRTPDKPTDVLFENEPKFPKTSLEDVRSENKLEKRIAGKKMLKSLDQPTENKHKPLEVPPQNNQIETSPRVAEPIESITEMERVQNHSTENCIQVINENLGKHKQDTISKEHVRSPKASVDGNAFKKEVDDILADPLEEELCRIHEESIAIRESRIPKEKSHPGMLTQELVNRRPIFQEPLTKKSRRDYLVEKLQFRGFTQEEQSMSLNLQNVYNSLISVVEGIQDRPLDIRSVRDSPVSAIESVHDKSSCNTPVAGMFNNPSRLDGSNKKTRRQYNCNKCDFRANQQSHLKVHLRAHLEPFWCNLCSQAFAQIEDLENHVRRYHSTDINDRNSRKNKSNEKLNDRVTLEKNLRSSGNSEKLFNKMNQQAYKCGFCNYCSSYIKRLQRHMKVHTREKVYSCEQCDYSTLNKWMIERHKSDHSKETQQYECEECGYITMYRNQLDEHLQLHSGQKLYKCDDCSFSTAHFGYFNAHVSFHQTKTECPSEYGDDEEPRQKPQMSYKCLQCGYYTQKHAALWRHAKMQHIQSKYIKVLTVKSNKEVYICTSCGYKAHSESMFNTHALMHKDVKPTKCVLCNFVADSEFNLKLHEINHNESSFKCTKCRRCYWTLQQLANHVMKVHNGDT